MEGNIVNKVNENKVGYSFLSDAHNEFHRHGQDLAIHLFTDQLTRRLFIKGTNDDQSIIWNENALAMWARAIDRMHVLLFYSCISLLAILLEGRSIKAISFATRSILIGHLTHPPLLEGLKCEPK